MRVASILFSIGIGAVLLGVFAFVLDRAGVIDVPHPARFVREWRDREALPRAKPYEPMSTTGLPSSASTADGSILAPASPEPPSQPSPSRQQPETFLNEVSLSVPFTSQAPHAEWDEFHQEFCEEASVLMAASYILGRDIPNADFADARMFEIKSFEEQRFGYWKDTTAEETATILREYYGIANVSVVYDPTIAQIRETVAHGKVVLVPAAGRQLGNPYFTQPGPLYHMLIVKGFTKDGHFITNDPGTRRGADFIYDPYVLLNAVHDWNGGDVDNGRKVMIVVG